jgi:hypothetical protein
MIPSARTVRTRDLHVAAELVNESTQQVGSLRIHRTSMFATEEAVT